MNLKELVISNRSCRKFHQEIIVEEETLRELVNMARLTASGSNLQPLKYIISCDPEKNARLFPHLRWAGYLKEWDGPSEGERPPAYIIILLDKNIAKSPGCDHGIAAQSIMLGATELGLGGCIIGSIERTKLASAVGIPDYLEILLILALGKPAEKVKIESVGPDGDIKYWRDDVGIHHVPKRSLEEILVD